MRTRRDRSRRRSNAVPPAPLDSIQFRGIYGDHGIRRKIQAPKRRCCFGFDRQTATALPSGSGGDLKTSYSRSSELPQTLPTKFLADPSV